jgi:uncharacterized protein GlcG (DUF336 family)
MANVRFALACALAICGFARGADDATYAVKLMTPETALAAARAALDKCRKEGFQVTVAVVDRSGVTQALLRDRFAAPHTVDTAQRKAWTAVNFKANTVDLDKAMQPGKPSAGIRDLPNVAAIAGGRVIEAGGSLLGGIGVSGAPGPLNDDVCAAEGARAIADSLEF